MTIAFIQVHFAKFDDKKYMEFLTVSITDIFLFYFKKCIKYIQIFKQYSNNYLHFVLTTKLLFELIVIEFYSYYVGIYCGLYIYFIQLRNCFYCIRYNNNNNLNTVNFVWNADAAFVFNVKLSVETAIVMNHRVFSFFFLSHLTGTVWPVSARYYLHHQSVRRSKFLSGDK